MNSLPIIPFPPALLTSPSTSLMPSSNCPNATFASAHAIISAGTCQLPMLIAFKGLDEEESMNIRASGEGTPLTTVLSWGSGAGLSSAIPLGKKLLRDVEDPARLPVGPVPPPPPTTVVVVVAFPSIHGSSQSMTSMTSASGRRDVCAPGWRYDTPM
jgi:hypothetical protein